MESVTIQVLIQTGVAGILLWWFMNRTEHRLDGLERSIDRLTRTQLLALLADANAGEAIKTQARALLAELPPQAPQLVGVGA